MLVLCNFFKIFLVSDKRCTRLLELTKLYQQNQLEIFFPFTITKTIHLARQDVKYLQFLEKESSPRNVLLIRSHILVDGYLGQRVAIATALLVLVVGNGDEQTGEDLSDYALNVRHAGRLISHQLGLGLEQDALQCEGVLLEYKSCMSIKFCNAGKDKDMY